MARVATTQTITTVVARASLALHVTHPLLHGVVVQKGSQVHGDITYDEAL